MIHVTADGDAPRPVWGYKKLSRPVSDLFRVAGALSWFDYPALRPRFGQVRCQPARMPSGFERI